MDQGLARWQDLAKRAAVDVRDEGALYDPDQPHSTANPYCTSHRSCRSAYLPDYATHAALVRFLPPNQAK